MVEEYRIISLSELYDIRIKVYRNGLIETLFNNSIRKNGRVFNRRGVILKPGVDKDGYLRIALSCRDKRKSYYVHRIVARAFLSNYCNELQVNHINGIKNDNRVENLEMVSLQENIAHSIRTGLKPKMLRDSAGRFCGKEVM